MAVKIKNQILKEHYSTDTCNSELDQLNLDTLFRLQENGELSVVPQSMTSDSLMPLSSLDLGVPSSPLTGNNN